MKLMVTLRQNEIEHKKIRQAPQVAVVEGIDAVNKRE